MIWKFAIFCKYSLELAYFKTDFTFEYIYYNVSFAIFHRCNWVILINISKLQ